MARIRSRSSRASGTSPSSRIEPVGNYAVRLTFDDLHDTGIYSWEYLHELGREQESRWQAYLAALDVRGMSREASRSGRELADTVCDSTCRRSPSASAMQPSVGA